MVSDHRRWGLITEDGIRSKEAEWGYFVNKRQLFGILTGVSIFIVMIIATIIFAKRKPKWTKQYERR